MILNNFITSDEGQEVIRAQVEKFGDVEGEQEDQKNGGGDLRQAGKSGEDEEPPTRVWQIMAAVPHEKIQVEQRERQTPQKTHIGGADGGDE